MEPLHLEFLVEELSAEGALRLLLPRLVGDDVTWRIHTYSGKPDLLRKLPSRLRGYSQFLPENWRIVVLVDRDQGDCHDLKKELDDAACQVGLITKSRSLGGAFTVLNRIAIEELEAWFFGDLPALRSAFPKLPSSLVHKQKYRHPDAILGGTFETLERLLQKHGYYPAGAPKIELAGRVAEHMDPASNRSPSFCVFRDGLQAMCS